MKPVPYVGRSIAPPKVVQSPFGPLRHLAKRADDQRSMITGCGCDATAWEIVAIPPNTLAQDGGATCFACLRALGVGTPPGAR